MFGKGKLEIGRCVLLASLMVLSSCYVSMPQDWFSGSTASQRGVKAFLADNGQTLFLPSATVEPLPPPELPLTPEVEQQIAHFIKRNPAFIRRGLSNRESYLPILREIFTDEGVPLELINVAFIESLFQPRAKSPAGAAGMWQFMRGTAAQYGLRTSIIQDQRKDPILASIAAARHLRDLYKIYGDWNLALAAYNGGTGTVNRAIRRAGTNDFWHLARSGHLNRETREFVPRFIAVSLIERDPAAFGFQLG